MHESLSCIADIYEHLLLEFSVRPCGLVIFCQLRDSLAGANLFVERISILQKA